MATVTVSIPTYNRSAYLRQALDSVLAQTFGDFVVMVSDNGSTDGTQDVVAEYARLDRRVGYHRFPENRGLASNFKHATSRPETEFIGLLPDDDLWLPHHLESAIEGLRSVDNAVVYGCTAEFFGDKSGGEVHRPYWATSEPRQVIDTSRQIVPWLREMPMAPVSVVFRTAARKGIVWYDDDTFGAMDWLFWGEVATRGATVFDSAVGVRLRWHASNQSQTLLKGKRSYAQSRYIMRRLATVALNSGALTTRQLIEEVVGTWTIGSAADLVVALASCDADPRLREAAVEIFDRTPGMRVSPQSIKHCRMAGRIGSWYLAFADPLDRVLARWGGPVSCPSPQ